MSRACLLLHGFVTSYHDFDPLIPKLKEIYDCVATVDFPGHGDEPNYKMFNEAETFDVMLNAFDELKREYEEVDVVGFSMGGALASYLCSCRDVHRAVLLAPANRYINISLPITRIIYLLRIIHNRLLSKDENEELMKKYSDVMTDDYKSLQMALKDLIPNYTYHTLTTFIRIIRHCNEGLTTIPNPTLVIWGEFDQLVPRKSVDSIIEICTNEDCELVVFDDISHLMLRSTSKDIIINKIVSFLKKEGKALSDSSNS